MGQSVVRNLLVAIVATLSLATASLCAAEPPKGIFTTYTSVDGMAHNNIHDIYIDSRGYVWLCTWSGVSRFDGYHFKNYCTDPKNMPVRHNRFRGVEEDGKGNLWFRTYDDHIYRFDPATELFEDICSTIPQLADKRHRAGQMICSPQSERVWIEYEGFGIVCFYPDQDNNLRSVNYIGNSLIGSDITHILADDNDNLWVAAESGSVCVIKPLTEQVEEVVSAQGEIVDIVEAGDNICLATANNIHWVDKQSHKVERKSNYRGRDLTTLAWDNTSATLYAASHSAGLWAEGDNGNTRHYRRGSIPVGVRDLFVDSHGTVWIADSRHGITRLDPNKGDYKHFEQKQHTVQFYTGINSLIIEEQDRVWIKMNHVGFGYYDREKDSVEPFYNDPTTPECRMSNGVAIFEIDNNVIWLSTYYERGLQRIVLQKNDENLFSLENNNLSSHISFLDEARAIISDKNHNIWVGTKEGHLYCYSPDGALLHHLTKELNGKPLGPIYTLLEDSHDNLWVGTKGSGIYRLHRNGNSYTIRQFTHRADNPHSLSDNQVYSIAEDEAGRIWVATYGGAINMLPSWDAEEFVNTTNNFPLYPTESGERVRYLLPDGSHRIYAGTSEGVLIFDPSTPPEKMQFTVAQRAINDTTSLQANDIIHIFKDSRGDVWFSTYGGGVSRIVDYSDDGTPRFETFTTSDGLASNVVMAATEAPDGSIWLSTEKGISSLNPTSKVITNHSRHDGVTPIVYSEGAALTDSCGRVVFGCASNALHIISPESIATNKYDYNLRLIGFEVQNSQESDSSNNNYISLDSNENIASPVRLRHDYRLFRVSFAALNFRLQDRVSYMYRLDGYESDWNVTNDFNNVYYSKVPHGRYTFRVKAFVDSPDSASAEISLPIHIATPPWVSWWAIMLYLLVAGGLMWFIGRLYVRMAKIRNEARIEQDMTEMKLKFFTNISHELRTPLTLIMGGIEEVKRHTTLPERAENSLNLSHKNAKRMLTLINQLLDFRKVVKNKMELKVELVDVVRLAGEVVEDFRDSAAEKEIELLLSVSNNHIMVWCDPERIESLLYNLISNALKFTKNGGRVTIEVSRKEGEKHTTISVSDTGIGIPKERQEAIFDRFASYASAVRGEVSGSGIGLSLCKEIVELHHGSIEVESKVGVGSRFTARLLSGNSHFTMEQIVFGDGQNTAEEQVNNLRRNDINPPQGAHKIVLAEDNSQMRAFIYNNLIETYDVIEAVDGVEALEKIIAEHPDIIITDLMMPRMDGIELVEKIRKNFDISHIPIIMLTAKQTPEDRIVAMKYGADGYITKPFSMELLLARIDNLLTQRRMIFEKMANSSAGNRYVEITPKEVSVTNRDEKFLTNLIGWLEENIENSDLTIEDLAGHLGLGRTTMYNKIKSLTGKSPSELIKEYRIAKSELLLRTGQFAISEVAYKVGFSDPSYFSRCFKEQYKASPLEYMRNLGIKREEN